MRRAHFTGELEEQARMLKVASLEFEHVAVQLVMQPEHELRERIAPLTRRHHVHRRQPVRQPARAGVGEQVGLVILQRDGLGVFLNVRLHRALRTCRTSELAAGWRERVRTERGGAHGSTLLGGAAHGLSNGLPVFADARRELLRCRLNGRGNIAALRCVDGGRQRHQGGGLEGAEGRDDIAHVLCFQVLGLCRGVRRSERREHARREATDQVLVEGRHLHAALLPDLQHVTPAERLRGQQWTSPLQLL